VTATELNITTDMTPIEAANLLARLEEGHQAAWRSTHETRWQGAEYDSRFHNAVEVDGIFRDVMWETVKSGMRYPGEPIEQFAQRAEAEAGQADAGSANVETADDAVRSRNVGVVSERAGESRAEIAARLLNDPSTPEGQAFARAVADTPAAYVRELRKRDPLPGPDRTPGTPHPDPFLANRGWHVNEHRSTPASQNPGCRWSPTGNWRRAEMRVVISTIVARRASMSALVADWIRRRQQELSEAVHAAGDERARDHGWEITKGTGRLGLGTRTYRDPRFGDQRRVPAEANPLRGLEWLINAGPGPGPIENFIVGNEAGNCQDALETGK